jgi:beta-glucosidase
VQVRLVDWPPAEMCKVGLAAPTLPDLGPASGADAVVACCGFRADSEHEGSDRDFDLPASQQRLVAALQQANPKTILIINSGAGTGLSGGADSAAAILQAWYLGQAGGTAIGEILFGDVNPSGHLPDTFDSVVDDNPAMAYYPGKKQEGHDYAIEPYTEGIYTGYRGYDKSGKDPLYPFGLGLSYTTFSFGNFAVTPAGDGAVATIDVTNTGHRAGAQVVQLYVGQPNSMVERPLRELKGFSKVQVAPGATEQVTIPLPRESFAYWSTDKHAWQVDPGTYTIEAGDNERDILAKVSFDVK